MTTENEFGTTRGTLAELLEMVKQLGGIPAERIRMNPYPGTATEDDVLAEREKPERRLCELVDGILVEKPMSTPESVVAVEIARRIGNHIEREDLGVILGEGGMLRLEKGLVRAPDVSFISWDNIPGGEVDVDVPIASLVPDLAVEVLSPSNTAEEIRRKLKEYFFHGTQLAWVIEPRKQSAKMYTSPRKARSIDVTGALDATPVLPGFVIPLADLLPRTRRRRKTG